MYILDNKYLLSEDLFNKQFVCNIDACKGACCWEGDFGAPLEEGEQNILQDIYPSIKSYLTRAGIDAIETQGVAIVDDENELSTTLIDGGPCAYINYTENGTAYCGIEKANLDGVIDWKKPISCHLYPIRIKKLPDYDALNYDKWDICSDACVLGEELKVPVYRFLKDALIRKYGEDFYVKLEDMANFHEAHKDDAR
jgi:hypothetical protein